MKNKMPKELDPETVFNILHKALYDAVENATSTFNCKTISVEQKQKTIHHIDARACGICDAIRLLGYEVYDGNIDVTRKPMGKLFALCQRVDLEED